MCALRRDLLDAIAARIAAGAVRRVGIDGVDGAGKTIFADELAGALRELGRPAVRVSLDGFHNLRQVRYRRGRSSPEGFWLDSYDYASFRGHVLAPFEPGGSRRYRRAIRDVSTDRAVDAEVEHAPPEAILVVDGLFLHRDELSDCWDFSVFLSVPFEVTFERMSRRNGFPPDPEDPANHRYVRGQQLYLAACAPESRADLVIDNTDPASPQVVSASPLPGPRR
jgi:uridine kinase